MRPPGGTILYKAHQCLEMITVDKDTAHMKTKLAVDFADLVYNGKWFTPLREALSAFAEKTQEHVTGQREAEAVQGQHNHLRRDLSRDAVLRGTGDLQREQL